MLGQIDPLGDLCVKTKVMEVVFCIVFVTLPLLVDDQYQYLELLCYFLQHPPKSQRVSVIEFDYESYGCVLTLPCGICVAKMAQRKYKTI